VNAYMQRLMHVALVDVEVSRAFLKVAHLVEPPSSLFNPRVVLRVLSKRAPPARAQLATDTYHTLPGVGGTIS
jgi:hypothetical protein